MWFGMIRSRLRFSSNFFRAIRLDDAKRIGTLVVSEGEGLSRGEIIQGCAGAG